MPYIIVFWTLNGERHLPAASLAPMDYLSRHGYRPQAWRDGVRVA